MSTFLDILKSHEGVIEHIYLDSVGLQTVGVGFLLRQPTDVLRYTWSDVAQAREDWFALQNLKGPEVEYTKLSARWYKKHTKARLLDVDSALQQKIQSFDSQLRTRGLPMDTIPTAAWEGVIDLAYNVGVAGLLGGFPKFCASLKAFDFKGCARECRRPQVSASRNVWCRGRFEKAAADWARMNRT
jgi:GH24 family phage-related lysozyme (muramidase)